MPIAGVTLHDPPIWYNVSDYSHSTVFTVTALYESSTQNVPTLLAWTAPAECTNRWMLIDNGPTGVGTETLGITTILQTQSALDTVTFTLDADSLSPTSILPVIATSSTPASPPLKVIRNAIVVVKRQEPNTSKSRPLSMTRAFQFTAWSLDSDPLFAACRPFSSISLYSPGMCPDGQTVAEVTEVHATETGLTTTLHTSWRASCCSSGMSFGSDVSRYCISTITSAIPAHRDLIKSHSSSDDPPLYESLRSTFTGSAGSGGGDGYSTVTISETTTLTQGLAVGDPVVIAWAMEDFFVFPSAYATSLASKIGVVLKQDATPASSSSLARSTGPVDAESAAPLATGAKVGIGVGAVLGIAVIIGVVLIFMRQKPSVAPDRGPVAEMEDQDEMNAKKRWFFGGRWRHEAENAARPTPELDSKVVHIVPGPPAELDGVQVEAAEEHRADVR